ncbi:insulinase-like Zn-dependent peptidase [Encephalitozoon cuniculi EcunIII-L]|nr:insulinase-like Zn-dependent peptidase [Encephalitozoon cuniculi EcunIII-L]
MNALITIARCLESIRMVHKNLMDTTRYEYVEIPNGMRALIMSDPGLDKCSCAVSVRVGSFDDPADAQGLAHFLEHMLFMGTEKYPVEDGLSYFLSKNNGGYNATTYGEATVYYFDVRPEAFEEAVDMFADFFKSPLLKRDSVEREVSAVNSEFCNGLNNDGWRTWRMMKKCCKKEQALSKFSTGNYDTLRRDGIWEEMKEFWSRKYSSDKMCVVIYGNKSPGELKELLGKFEGVLKGHGEDSCDKKDRKCRLDEGWSVFDEEYTNRWIRIQPIADTRSIMVMMTVESGYKMFKNNPYEYVLNMILRNDSKGFACKVKDMGLVLEVEGDLCDYTDYSVMIITMHLSAAGNKRPKEAVLELVKYLKTMPVCLDEYAELQKRSRYLFKYDEKDDPMYQTKRVAVNMQFYPVENVLDHEHCFERFDGDEIRGVVLLMADFSRWVVFHIAKDAGTFDMREEIYGVRYGVGDRIFEAEDIDAENSGVVEWKEGEMIRTEIPSDILTKELPGGKISYLFNDSYKVPKVFAGYLIRTENSSSDVVNMMFLARNAKDQFFKRYDGSLYKTGVEIDVRVESRGVEIRIECFNHMSVEVSRMFFDILFGEPDGSRRHLIKEEIWNELEVKRTSNPYKRCRDGMKWMKVPGHLMAEEAMERLDSVDTKSRLSRKFFLEMFVVGNIEYSDAEKMFRHVLTKQEEIHSCGRNELLDGRYRCDINTCDERNNACALSYYCGRYGNHKDVAVAHLVHHSCKAMFFDQLRTKEELGYVVISNVTYIDDEQYITFVVQSEKDVEFLEKRIRRFVEELEGYFKEMSLEDFEKFKSGVISSFRERKKNFVLYSTEIWDKCLRGVVDQEHDEKVVEAVKEISKENLSVGKILGQVYVSRVFAH